MSKTATTAKKTTSKKTTAKKESATERAARLAKRNIKRAEKVEKIIDGLTEWVGTDDAELSALCEAAASFLSRYHTILGRRAERYATAAEG